MLEKLSDSEIRDYCRARIEALELWLCRLIDEKLRAAAGDNYFDNVDANGDRLIKKQIVESLDLRIRREPTRYPRRVDAIFLDDAIAIILKPKLYVNCFRDALDFAFPEGESEARTFLSRIQSPRNKLAHANPISLREAEQVVCYTGDVIDSIKNYYAAINMSKEYNVPTIVRLIDSFGNVLHRAQMATVHDGGISARFDGDLKCILQPGDTLSVEIEVDATFDRKEYDIQWASTKGIRGVPIDQAKLVLPIAEAHVGNLLDVQCRITSKKGWHRMHMGADDFLMLYYKVLPPAG